MFTWEIMSWLFKNPNHVLIVQGSSSNHESNHVLTVTDPIVTGTWLNFNHAQSNPRLKRSNYPKWNFFSKNNKIFMYLLAPFILQNFKRILRADPELSGCAIFVHKMVHLSWTNFFWYKPLLFSSTCWPFSLCKIYKQFLQPIQVVRIPNFSAQNGPFAPIFFFLKIINIIFI